MIRLASLDRGRRMDGIQYCGIQPANISLNNRRMYGLRRLQKI